MRIHFLLLLILALCTSCSIQRGVTDNAQKPNELVELSIAFLEALKHDRPTTTFKDQLKSLTVDEVSTSLATNEERTAFWVNIYNAYIQDILKNDPLLYEDRGKFFREPRIDMLGRVFSFGEIEHGIIRRSQNEYGLGYIRKWFPPKWERELRVFDRDYRIHFALNCGAKDCPPVALYNSTILNEQLNISTEKHLQKTSTYVPTDNKVKITSLFLWFRGDFGGKSGTKTILKSFNIIPEDSNPSLDYTSYDWTLDLDNYIDLK